MSYNQEFFMEDFKQRNSYSDNYSQKEKDNKNSQNAICCVNTVCFYPVWNDDCKEKDKDDKRPCHNDSREKDKDEKFFCNSKCECREDKKDHDFKQDEYKDKNDREEDCFCREDKKDDRNDKNDYYSDKQYGFDDKQNNRENKQNCHNNQKCCRCQNRCCCFCCRNWRW